jgi:hypothetical protein
MSAEIVTLPPPREPGAPMPLQYAAERALKLLQLAQGHLAGIKRGWGVSAAACIGIAIDDLERGIRGNVEAAQRDLSVEIITALGPGVTVGEVRGARKLLAILLDALPDDTEGSA